MLMMLVISFAPAKVRSIIYIASDLFKSLRLFNIRSCAIHYCLVISHSSPLKVAV